MEITLNLGPSLQYLGTEDHHHDILNIITTSEDIWQWKAPIGIAISAIYQVKKTTSLHRARDLHPVFQVISLSQERVQPNLKIKMLRGLVCHYLI